MIRSTAQLFEQARNVMQRESNHLVARESAHAAVILFIAAGKKEEANSAMKKHMETVSHGPPPSYRTRILGKMETELHGSQRGWAALQAGVKWLKTQPEFNEAKKHAEEFLHVQIKDAAETVPTEAVAWAYEKAMMAHNASNAREKNPDPEKVELKVTAGAAAALKHAGADTKVIKSYYVDYATIMKQARPKLDCYIDGLRREYAAFATQTEAGLKNDLQMRMLEGLNRKGVGETEATAATTYLLCSFQFLAYAAYLEELHKKMTHDMATVH